MSNGAIVINQQQAKSLIGDLMELEAGINKMKTSLANYLPAPYGSSLWWKKSDAEAIKSIKSGNGKKFSSLDEALEYLHS